VAWQRHILGAYDAAADWNALVNKFEAGDYPADAPRLKLDQPAEYEITVQGLVSDRREDWLGNMARTATDDQGLAVTTLSGTVADQAAWMGLLQTLYNLGFPLLRVNLLEDDSTG
jgi:hypothetical protein